MCVVCVVSVILICWLCFCDVVGYVDTSVLMEAGGLFVCWLLICRVTCNMACVFGVGFVIRGHIFGKIGRGLWSLGCY